MTKRTSLLFFIIFILINSTLVRAQSLWKDTVSGMKPLDVIKSVKGSNFIKNGASIASGGKELIRLDSTQLANESFKVRFYFINERLVQVTLSQNIAKTFTSSLVLFESISTILRSEYGKEKSREIDNGRFRKAAQANWLNGSSGSRVNLYLSTVDESIAKINLNYQTKLSMTPLSSSTSGIYKCKVKKEIIYQSTKCKEKTEQSIISIQKAPPSEYSKRELNLIATRKISVGMSKKALLRSWGKPDKINDSSFGSAQWIYDRGNANRQYVYVKDGYVTNWQN